MERASHPDAIPGGTLADFTVLILPATELALFRMVDDPRGTELGTSSDRAFIRPILRDARAVSGAADVYGNPAYHFEHLPGSRRFMI